MPTLAIAEIALNAVEQLVQRGLGQAFRQYDIRNLGIVGSSMGDPSAVCATGSHYIPPAFHSPAISAISLLFLHTQVFGAFWGRGREYALPIRPKMAR